MFTVAEFLKIHPKRGAMFTFSQFLKLHPWVAVVAGDSVAWFSNPKTAVETAAYEASLYCRIHAVASIDFGIRDEETGMYFDEREARGLKPYKAATA